MGLLKIVVFHIKTRDRGTLAV